MTGGPYALFPLGAAVKRPVPRMCSDKDVLGAPRVSDQGVPVAEPGRVVESSQACGDGAVPDQEHDAASRHLRELSASDCSPETLGSCAFNLWRCVPRAATLP
jgi:hypothetical protein